MNLINNNSNLLTRWIIIVAIAFLGPTATASAQTDLTQPQTNSARILALDEHSIDSIQSIESGVTSQEGIKQATPQDKSPLSQARIHSIHNSISMLKKLMEKDAEAMAKREVEAQSTERNSGQIRPTNLPENSADPVEGEVPATTNAEFEPSIAVSEPPVSGTPVVAQPINPFKLANSLFRTGNLDAARKSYEAGLAEATAEERLWLKCFIGCCYRLQGDYANAEMTFRDVTNDRSATFPVDYSKWSLRFVEQRRNSLEQYRQLASEIDSIVEELKKDDGN